jgi:hypothetical protein
MSSSEFVRFDGPWSGPERELIEAAVTTAESDPSLAEIAPLWVATCHKRASSNMYAASRIRLSEVLVAQKADALAERIQGAVPFPETLSEDRAPSNARGELLDEDRTVQ